jgi:DNA polymerase III epsilon subunit-like protein
MSKKSKYLVLDTETTGLSPFKNGLIQVAMAALDESLEITATFNVDVCPPDGYEKSPEAMKITGFSQQRIDAGISYEDLAINFLKFLKTNFNTKPIVVAQFYPFDYSFISMAFSKAGYEEKIMQKWLSNDFIDTKAIVHGINLAYKIAGFEPPFPSTSLSKPGGLKDKLEIIKDFKAHDALGDVLATREVLIKILPYLKTA